MKRRSEFLRKVSAVLFTEHCVSCQKTVSVFNKSGFCGECEKELSFFENPVFENEKGEILVSCAAYSSVWRRTILNFKFGSDKCAGRLLAEKLAETIEKNIDIKTVNGILYVPVFKPLGSTKFNQAEYLARKVGRMLSLPVYRHLKKRRDIKSQTACKTSAERMKNVEGAYGISFFARRRISGRTFIVIDDVETTGATLAECGKVLAENGASKVYYATAARTVLSYAVSRKILRPGNGDGRFVTLKKKWKKPDNFEKAAKIRIMKNEIFGNIKSRV